MLYNRSFLTEDGLRLTGDDNIPNNEGCDLYEKVCDFLRPTVIEFSIRGFNVNEIYKVMQRSLNDCIKNEMDEQIRRLN